MMWFLQIAQLSTTISASKESPWNQHSKALNSRTGRKGGKKKKGEETRVRVRRKLLPQAQRATAFHFLISKRLGFLLEGPALLEGSPAGTMGTSESKVAIASRRENEKLRLGGFGRALCFCLGGERERERGKAWKKERKSVVTRNVDRNRSLRPLFR